MFLIVRVSDNTIVGCAVKPVSAEDMSKKGNKIYEIDNSLFDYAMIGQKLDSFDIA